MKKQTNKNITTMLIKDMLICSTMITMLAISLLIDSDQQRNVDRAKLVTEHNQRQTKYNQTQLAVLISNKDMSIEEINEIAQEMGYNNYYDACLKLAKDNLLVYIPSHTENGKLIKSTFTRPGTIRAEKAREAGLI